MLSLQSILGHFNLLKKKLTIHSPVFTFSLNLLGPGKATKLYAFWFLSFGGTCLRGAHIAVHSSALLPFTDEQCPAAGVRGILVLCMTIQEHLFSVFNDKKILQTFSSSFVQKNFISLGWLEVRLLSSRKVLLNCINQSFPKSLYHSSFPPTVYDRSSCLISLPIFCVVCVSNLSNSYVCVVVFHCGFYYCVWEIFA